MKPGVKSMLSSILKVTNIENVDMMENLQNNLDEVEREEVTQRQVLNIYLKGL